MNPTVEPRIYFIDDIITLMSNGKIQVPDFQRGYVWSNEQIRELFDSLYKGFPIGSVLLWKPESGLELNTVKYINIETTVPSDETYYIIDGQQRLTTFFMCLFSRHSQPDDKWNIFFDLRTEKFIHLKNNTSELKPHYLELRKITNTINFMKESNRIYAETNDYELIERAQSLVDKITKYRLSATELRGGGVEQAIEIFTRLNREGMKVSEWDYVRALSKKSHSGKLNLILDNIESLLDEHSFGSDDDKNFTLKIIQTSFDFPIYDSVWKQLSEKISAISNDELNHISTSVQRAIEFSRVNLHIKNISNFPYMNQFYMIIGYFINNQNYDLRQLECEFYYAAINEIP
ncbi:DUF262 domain-containing protein, partial [Vibrio parahaemolyticus]|nr:DUF262 domain-containing protein [Vibrio parahaemolyticus]